jgi:hypothetical protein
MKKRAATKKKSVAKPAAKKKSGSARTGKPAAKPAAPARASSYTPGPIKGEGWPPFRYPLQ